MIGVVGLFASTLLVAWLDQRRGLSTPSLLYVRLSCGAFISVLLTGAVGMVESVFQGSFYQGWGSSGRRWRTVRRRDQPVRFWVTVAVVYLCLGGLIALGVWRWATIGDGMANP
jgi:hypothetical protein